MYDESVVDYFATLHSHYAINDIHFSHTTPDQDASDPVAYYLGPRPEDEGAIAPTFSRFTHRVFMVGHFHRWFAATPTGRLHFDGNLPTQLERGERYFFVIHAVMDGWAAILDEDRDVLTPICL